MKRQCWAQTRGYTVNIIYSTATIMNQGSSLFTINPVSVIVTKQVDIAMRMVTYLHTCTIDFVRLYMFWPKWFQKQFQSTYFSK